MKYASQVIKGNMAWFRKMNKNATFLHSYFQGFPKVWRWDCSMLKALRFYGCEEWSCFKDIGEPNNEFPLDQGATSSMISTERKTLNTLLSLSTVFLFSNLFCRSHHCGTKPSYHRCSENSSPLTLKKYPTGLWSFRIALFLRSLW